MSHPADGPRWHSLASVFLVSFAVLAFEVSLTRVFSVLFSYHFVFLAVSGAVCGLGLGGFGWHLLSRQRRHPIEAGWAALAFALLMPGSIILLFGAAGLLAASPWCSLAILLPFACAGAFLAEVFRLRAADSGRFYQADLAGAAIAALSVIPLIHVTGALYLVFCLGGMAALGAALWSVSHGPRLLSLASIVCGVMLFVSWPLSQESGVLQLRPLRAPASAIEKELVRDLSDPRRALLIDTDWTAYARTDFVRFELPDEGAYVLQLYTDGGTPSTMVPFKGDLEQVSYIRADLPYLAFDMAPRERLLSIGPGGGMDLLWAKLAGFRELDGVEINESVAHLMDRYRGVNGNLYHQPGVHVAVEDGRSFVRRSTRQYDLISSSLTQTATTGTAGLPLVESYIHTQQAFDDYYRHLTPDGRYALVSQERALLLRAALTALAVMRARGIATSDAYSRLVAVGVPNPETLDSPYQYLLIWKRSPLTAADLRPILRAIRLGTAVPIHLPGGPSDAVLGSIPGGAVSLTDARSSSSTGSGVPVDLRPATDDRPFFLDLTPGVPGMLVYFMLASLCAVLLYSLALLARRGDRRRGAGGWLLNFGALGVGFMLVEIPMIEKLILLLGRPTLSLASILFYLLIGASLGSRLSQAWPLETIGRRVAIAAAVVCSLVVVYVLLLGPLVRVLLPFSLPVRLLSLGLIVLPAGVALGVPFPSGLRLMASQWQAEIPWMWGVNGVMSVTGSALAMSASKLIGFNGCFVIAGVLYAGVAVLATRPYLRAGPVIERDRGRKTRGRSKRSAP